MFPPAADAFAGPPADIPALTQFLLYHLVSGSVPAAGVVGLDSATTLRGQSVSISVDGDSVPINDPRVVITDIPAANGTVHVIDSVLIPQGLLDGLCCASPPALRDGRPLETGSWPKSGMIDGGVPGPRPCAAAPSEAMREPGLTGTLTGP